MAATKGAHRVVHLCRGLLERKEVGRAFSSGRGGRNDGGGSDNVRDADLDSLFWTSTPRNSSSVNPESSSSDNSDLWKSLTKEPSSSSAKQEWDFLSDIDRPPLKYSSPRAQNSYSSGPSFRKLGDPGVDFLTEALNRPATTRPETAAEQKTGTLDILNSATFNLLKATFQKPDVEKKAKLDGILGLDSGSLFSSEEGSSKRVDLRSLAEVEEGKFYSASHPSFTEAKTYTYDELGEKLRQARPPMAQVLHSATGLSFGELRTRFQKIEQAENDEVEDQIAFSHLKEGLNQLIRSPKSLVAKKQLSYEDLVFVNHVGKGTGFDGKIEYTPPKDELLTKYYSEAQLSSKERLKLEIKKLREEFQTHDCDSGSPQVQIAILTARINNLNRHMREGPNYKRDKHSKKGLNDMVQYRKRLLRYLRRRDWNVYCNVLTKLKLDDVILEKRR